MSTKRKLYISSPQSTKKERKAIDFDTKMSVIKQYEDGKRVSVIARDTKLPCSTVSTILKDRERIREAVKGMASMRSTVISKQRTGPIQEMEKLLYLWIQERIQNREEVRLLAIQEKARSLFHMLSEREGKLGEVNREFMASNGWFQRFKKRFQLDTVRVTGQIANTDDGGSNFINVDKIKDEGILTEQIYNVDENSLFTNGMSENSYIQNENTINNVNNFPVFESEEDLDGIKDKMVKLSKDVSLECGKVEDTEGLMNEEQIELEEIRAEGLANEEQIELEEMRAEGLINEEQRELEEMRAEGLANEEQIELEERREEETEKENEPQRRFTNNGLMDGFRRLDELLAHFEAMDPNVKRFVRIERMVKDAFYPYRLIHEDKKKQVTQTKITMFMKRTSPAATS